MRTKAHDQEAHALRRAFLRYGLRLTQHDLQMIRRAIQDGHSRCVQTQSHRISVHDLDYGESKEPIRVVYDKQRKTIVTFLTREMGVWE